MFYTGDKTDNIIYNSIKKSTGSELKFKNFGKSVFV